MPKLLLSLNPYFRNSSKVQLQGCETHYFKLIFRCCTDWTNTYFLLHALEFYHGVDLFVPVDLWNSFLHKYNYLIYENCAIPISTGAHAWSRCGCTVRTCLRMALYISCVWSGLFNLAFLYLVFLTEVCSFYHILLSSPSNCLQTQ